MTVDKNYCMNSYLMYRYLFNNEFCFLKDMPCTTVDLNFGRMPVKNANDLLEALKENLKKCFSEKKAVLALSGGIDSAILAKLVPHGTKAYTFKCVVSGVDVIDESSQAKIWADINGLQHEVIEIFWEDIEAVVDNLMLHKGAPIHSIEAQIYIAAKKAKQDGFSAMIFGENADIIYGGMDGLLKKDWYFGEFVDRYIYVNPYHVLKNPNLIFEPFFKFEKDGHIDGHDFINTYFRQEALGTYINACKTAGIEFIGPYSMTYLNSKIDYARIRNGDTKYIVRELFKELYPNYQLPQKIPMPRPVNEWFANWSGPKRDDFLPHCADILTGDQKWMVWALERFLNLIDKIHNATEAA